MDCHKAFDQDQQKGGFGNPVAGEDGQQWMAPVQEQMVPLNCPPGLNKKSFKIVVFNSTF